MSDDLIDEVGFILSGLDFPETVQVVRSPAPLRGIAIFYRDKMMMVDLYTKEREAPGTHSCRWYTITGHKEVLERATETTKLSDLFDAVADFVTAARRQDEAEAAPPGA